MRNRISALLLVLFASLPGWGYYQYESNEDGVTITWASDEITGDVQIPSDLWGEKVTRIGTGVFRNRGTIRSVAIPSTVTVIEEGAFEKCTSLERVSGCYDDWIEGGHLKDIGNSAFSGCSMLSEFDFQSSITNIGISAFEGCSQLRLSGSLSAESIGERAFYGCSLVYPDGNLVLGETVKYIGAAAFSIPGSASWFQEIIVPANVIRIDSGNFDRGQIVFLGRTQLTSDYAERADSISVNPKYRGYYQSLLGEDVHDYRMNSEIDLSVRIIMCQMRTTDPTLMDIKYMIVSDTEDVVDTRVLAFSDLDYGRSFANIVRPETFLDGAQIGNDIMCNVTNSFTWRVSADLDTQLSKLKIDIIARKKGSSLLPLDFVAIPATESTRAMQVSVNELLQEDYLKALFWLYADKDPALTVKNGILYASGNAIAQQSQLSVIVSYESHIGTYRRAPKSYEAAKYIFGKMGFDLLESNGIAKSLATTTLKRSFASGSRSSTIAPNLDSYRQFAYKYLDE